MSIRTLNLGILAHVDAGKTSLTERLLFDAGVISQLGSVDGGSTQTDSGELERQRGITIRTAVASFRLGDLQVNLVDTPGHPDFIAEVDRAISVLDGAVLVISAVEGVQAQTRVLMRSLKRVGLPTLIFVNKVDRMGARYDDLLAEIRRKLTPVIAPMVRVDELGRRDARVLPRSFTDEDFCTEVTDLVADHDEELLVRVVEGVAPTGRQLRELLRRQVRRAVVHPVFFGSALSGAGTRELAEGVREFLAPDPGRSDAPLRGTVFAIERTGKGEKVAYLRLFSGMLNERQQVTFRHRGTGGVAEEYRGRIARLEVIGAAGRSGGARATVLTPGNIAKLRGLPGVRVGDRLGEADDAGSRALFSPPIVESVVRADPPERQTELHAALVRLADEDPLIRTRTVPGGGTSVQLYGVVQQEVLADRLRREFGLDALFEQVQPVYFERPVGRGEAFVEFDPRGPNEFWQTLGIRVEPAPPGTGNTFRRDVEWGVLPRAYHRAIEDAALATLQQGLRGWEVTDCAVTITKIGCEAPMTSAADFRHLTPMILMRALDAATTAVYEPCYAIEVEVPPDCLSSSIRFLMSLGAELGQPVESGSAWTVTGQLPARCLQDLAAALPGLTHGEGNILYEAGGDRRVRGAVPTRDRSDGNPLDHDEYLRFLSNRDLGGSGSAPR